MGGDRVGRQEGYFPYTPAALSRERNGKSRLYIAPAVRDGWSKAVFNVLGGVAGKVWSFCTTGAFRGFYAGGGNNFQMRPPQQTLHGETRLRGLWPEKDDTSLAGGRESTPIPDQLSNEDYIPDYIPRDFATPPRPAKKVQRVKGEGGLKANWVLVGSTPRSQDRSPSRSPTRKTPATRSPERRPHTATGRPVTSKAGRRPILPASRPSLTSFAGSPALHLNGPASFASSRSPGGTPVKGTQSLSREAKIYAAKVRKREVEDDAMVKRLNQQMKALIREGKEALGTKVEVDVDDEMEGLVDEGYAEGDCFETKDSWQMER